MPHFPAFPVYFYPLLLSIDLTVRLRGRNHFLLAYKSVIWAPPASDEPSLCCACSDRTAWQRLEGALLRRLCGPAGESVQREAWAWGPPRGWPGFLTTWRLA